MNWTIVCIVGLVLAAATTDAAYADDSHQCFFESIQATFTATTSTYRVEAGCKEYYTRTSAHWTSHGSYDSGTGVAREDVMLESGTVTTTLSCPSDPWLGPSLQPGMVVCTNPTFKTSGGGDYFTSGWFGYLHEGFYSLSHEKIGPLPNSTGFQYHRGELIAQRNAALRAEAAAARAAQAAEAAAALQRQNKRLNQAKQPVARFAPTILLPTANALFMQNNAVPIKLLPPQGMQVTGFLVKLERLDGNGNWGVVTNLPIGIGEATSQTGYAGWGTPGNGRDPSRMVSLPGSYRISAQVASPHQTAWSSPVPFAVTSPKRAIQKAPKMFGP